MSALLPSTEEPSQLSQLAELADGLVDQAPAYGKVSATLGLQPFYELPVERAQVHAQRAQQQFIAADDITYKARANFALETKPFDRAMAKLPLQPEERLTGPKRGPMAASSEPLWFEMSHRLSTLMNKAEKRMARRKKRRAKRAESRSRKPDAGRDLRTYLDEKTRDFLQEEQDRLYEIERSVTSEFVDKVKEQRWANQGKAQELANKFVVRSAKPLANSMSGFRG
jgi:hypothetical protein